MSPRSWAARPTGPSRWWTASAVNPASSARRLSSSAASRIGAVVTGQSLQPRSFCPGECNYGRMKRAHVDQPLLITTAPGEQRRRVRPSPQEVRDHDGDPRSLRDRLPARPTGLRCAARPGLRRRRDVPAFWCAVLIDERPSGPKQAVPTSACSLRRQVERGFPSWVRTIGPSRADRILTAWL